jgi:hypothetical protein
MSAQDNGGPAFPGFKDGLPVPGMDLRDWFAGQALAGLMAECNENDNARSALAKKRGMSIDQTRTSQAYQIADAMLAERKKEGV